MSGLFLDDFRLIWCSNAQLEDGKTDKEGWLYRQKRRKRRAAAFGAAPASVWSATAAATRRRPRRRRRRRPAPVRRRRPAPAAAAGWRTDAADCVPDSVSSGTANQKIHSLEKPSRKHETCSIFPIKSGRMSAVFVNRNALADADFLVFTAHVCCWHWNKISLRRGGGGGRRKPDRLRSVGRSAFSGPFEKKTSATNLTDRLIKRSFSVNTRRTIVIGQIFPSVADKSSEKKTNKSDLHWKTFLHQTTRREPWSLLDLCFT